MCDHEKQKTYLIFNGTHWGSWFKEPKEWWYEQKILKVIRDMN